MAKSILIILHGAIGDVVKALPLAARIKKTWPDSKITWGAEPTIKGLVENNKYIDRVVTFNRPEGFKAYRKYIKELQSEKYDIVLDLQRHLKSGITSFLSKGKRRIGFHRINSREFNWLFNHETVTAKDKLFPKMLIYQEFGDLLELDLMDFDYGLTVPEQSKVHVEQLLKNELERKGLNNNSLLVSLIIGSTWESRKWLVEKYVKLIKDLKNNYNVQTVIVGAKSEIGLATEIESRLDNVSAINLVNQISLIELFYLFQKTSFAIGTDTGPTHLAAAAGLDVITLWGATSPKRSAPPGMEKLVLQSPIGCSPCYKHNCPLGNNLCMQDIPTEAVLSLVERVIENR